VDMQYVSASSSRSYYEIKHQGPDNRIIDVTENGWIGT
jgi:hypothetical protein